jgi:hypothetical protein
MNIFQEKRFESDDDEQAYDLLSRAGFTVLEISRLIQLRRDYRASELDQIVHVSCVSPKVTSTSLYITRWRSIVVPSNTVE